MIHFDFVVTDEEAEEIFAGIQELLLANIETRMNYSEKHPITVWSLAREKMLMELKEKMTNRRVE